MPRLPKRLVTALLVAALAALLQAPAARSADPVEVPWTSLLPGLPLGYSPSSNDICRSGKVQCVDAVIREMQRRYRPLANSCSHAAPFALLYLRVTQVYRQMVEDPTFFSDNAFVNYEDAVFASYYFRAQDDWVGGRRSRVPAAWRIAFDAADRHAVSGGGNILLGVNAHVNRDLPFVLAAIGLVKPDGSSRKPDHDKVNQVFNRAYGPAMSEAARRYDPTISNEVFDGTTADDTTLLQLLVTWREQAWRNAERLVSAPTEASRALVARDIEAAAEAEALSIRQANAYLPPLTSSAARDAYCAAGGG